MEDVTGDVSNNQSSNNSQQRTANQSAAAVRSVANHSEVID